jgi:hypothetical protein
LVVTYVRHGDKLLKAVVQSTSAPVGACDTGGREGVLTGGVDGGETTTGGGVGKMAGAGTGVPSRAAHLPTSAGTLQSVEISNALVTLPSPLFGFWSCCSSSQRQIGALLCTCLKAVQQLGAGAGSVPCT